MKEELPQQIVSAVIVAEALVSLSLKMNVSKAIADLLDEKLVVVCRDVANAEEATDNQTKCLEADMVKLRERLRLRLEAGTSCWTARKRWLSLSWGV